MFILLVSLEVEALLVATVVIGELVVGLGERGVGVEDVMVVDGQDMLMLAVEVGDMQALVSLEVVALLVATEELE